MVNRSSALYDFKFAKVCFMAKDIAGHGECPLEKTMYVCILLLLHEVFHKCS